MSMDYVMPHSWISWTGTGLFECRHCDAEARPSTGVKAKMADLPPPPCPRLYKDYDAKMTVKRKAREIPLPEGTELNDIDAAFTKTRKKGRGNGG